MDWFVKSKRAQTSSDDETWIRGGVAPTMNAFDQGDSRATVLPIGEGGVARRLTPIECERLQGFPDDWTGGQADSHRFRQMGNAVTVPVAEYLGWLLRDAEGGI